jgi:hypothetical protein
MVSIKHVAGNSSGFLLSYFILAIVLPVIEILIVFIVNLYIYNFPRFSKIALICVNGITSIIIINIIIIINYYAN